MVVIAIVGILTAVGLPELTKAQDRAKDSAAAQTLTNAAKECAIDLLSGAAAYDFTATNYADITSSGTKECEAGATLTLASKSGNGSEKEANIVFDGVVPGVVSLDTQ